MSYYSIYGLFKFGPAVDLEYVPRLPGQLLLDDTNHKGIPMILGHTSLDGLLFTPPRIRDDETLGQYLSELYPRAPDSLFETVKKDNYYGIPDKKETLEITKINTVSNLWDDIAISCNNHYLTNAAVKNDSATPVWRYLFSAKPATHGLDVPFTVRSPFYRLPSYFYYPTEDPPAFIIPKIAKFMQKKYVICILNGNPNGGGEDLEWPRYEDGPGKRSVIKFGDLARGDASSSSSSSSSSVITDPMKDYRCDLWQDAPFQPREDDDWMLKKAKGGS
ncbi:MAG: hypothetical protein L6R40_001762 [Gallowayella cf. fulva]|nr:MAG: hypothetical protein L6R40_001762 [Xanthomendoza cf. fulva]